MGQTQGKDDHPGTEFIQERRAKIASERFASPQEEKIFRTSLSDWRKQDKVNPAALDVSRKNYSCSEKKIVTLDKIPRWSEVGWPSSPEFVKLYEPNEELNSRVSVMRCNICHMEIDAIVNAANNTFLGGGGIDGAIHGAAGSLLMRECATHNGLRTGASKITKGYKLPCRYIIHTVGPQEENVADLISCYRTVLQCAIQNNVKTVALCCISTGIFGYPLGRASQIAMETVRTVLLQNDNYKHFERVIFVVYMAKEEKVYNELMPVYFPLTTPKQSQMPEDPVLLEERNNGTSNSLSTSSPSSSVIPQKQEATATSTTISPNVEAATVEIPNSDTVGESTDSIN